ncbi:MAG: EI24 domain-containing protein [Alphaproteobacteria bacterium]|nr:EI24 domain-containing protein [Alphaproteobacteria bacterium]
MGGAFFRAIGALGEPPMRRVVALSLALAVLSFAMLWLAIAALLYHTSLFEWRVMNWLVDLLGGLAVLGLTWLLFPAVVTLIMSFYLERVAAAVEATDYPERGPPRSQPLGEIVAVTLRLTMLTLLLNLLALPIYLLFPGINIFFFLALNGYLFGRGYFEVVALRRLDAGEARAVRNRFAGRIFLGGVVIAGLFALPLVNLVAPVIATAFMLHIFEALPRAPGASLWPRP